MEYDNNKLVLVKKAVMDYMLHRFPTKLHSDTVPTFAIIAASDPVSNILSSFGQEGGDYLREALRDLVSKAELEIKRAGKVHLFIGKLEDSLGPMFDSLKGENVSISEKIEYSSTSSHLGYCTPYDNDLIWCDPSYNPETDR